MNAIQYHHNDILTPKPITSLNEPFKIGSIVGRFREVILFIYVMYSALREYKGVEGNSLLPCYYYYYYYYSTILNTIYCLLKTGGATCGALTQLHSLEPSLTSEVLKYCKTSLIDRHLRSTTPLYRTLYLGPNRFIISIF